MRSDIIFGHYGGKWLSHRQDNSISVGNSSNTSEGYRLQIVYDKPDISSALAQSQPTLDACSWLDYGKQSKALFHCQGHSANQDGLHRGFYDEPVDKQRGRCHSLLRTFGKCNYPVQERLLQRRYILGFGNLFAFQVSIPLSNLGAYHHGAVELLGVLQVILLLLLAKACVLSVYLSKQWQSFPLSPRKVCVLNNSCFLSLLERSLLLLQDAMQDCLSYSWLINLASYPYFNYSIHQGKVQAQWN